MSKASAYEAATKFCKANGRPIPPELEPEPITPLALPYWRLYTVVQHAAGGR